MKKLLLSTALVAVLAPLGAQGAHELTAGDLNASFDFNTYTGAGFSLTPAAGQLPTNAYAVSGMSEGKVNFGGEGTAGDFARGTTTGGVTTGGAYAFDFGGGNMAVGFQPTGTDFNPGSFYINVINNTGATITEFNISYGVVVRNDQERSSSLNFSYAIATVDTTAGTGTDPTTLTYTAVPALNFTSPEASTPTPAFVTTPRAANITGVSVLNGQSIVLNFSSADVAGSGSRDEIGIDNVSLTVVPEPTTAIMLLGGAGMLALMRRRTR